NNDGTKKKDEREHVKISTRTFVHAIVQRTVDSRYLLIQLMSDKQQQQQQQHEYDLPSEEVGFGETLVESAEKCIAKQAGIHVQIKGIVDFQYILNQFPKGHYSNDYNEFHVYFFAEHHKS
ncbi:hypothetical protein RFI_35280, partial [Reticulomyxa filosa]